MWTKKEWRAIHFVEGQTIKEFLKQFKNFTGEETIVWSAIGGIFRSAISTPGPDGKVHCYLTVVPKEKGQEKGQGPEVDTTVFPPDQFQKQEKGECATSKTTETLRPPLTEFEQELRKLINSYSMENHSNTPDNILAEYLCSCLDVFGRATMQRERWYGRRVF